MPGIDPYLALQEEVTEMAGDCEVTYATTPSGHIKQGSFRVVSGDCFIVHNGDDIEGLNLDIIGAKLVGMNGKSVAGNNTCYQWWDNGKYYAVSDTTPEDCPPD